MLENAKKKKIKNDIYLWSSHCGATGSAASWERWDAGSIPGSAQWVKDSVWVKNLAYI